MLLSGFQTLSVLQIKVHDVVILLEARCFRSYHALTKFVSVVFSTDRDRRNEMRDDDYSRIQE